jgi:pimeloyl-ACP methyl ester carboxylesterase
VLALAISRPEAVAAMVLHNPPEVRELDRKYVAGMLDYANYIEREGMDAVTDLILNLPPNDQLRKTHPRLIESYDKIMRAQNARVVAAATRGTACSAPMTKEQLNAIKAPTLIISSEGDGLHPSELARFLLDSVPNSEGLLGDSLTYFSDNPDAVPQRIMEFLSKVDGVSWD